MSIELPSVNTTIPAVPTTPTSASGAQVVAHQSAIQSALSAIAALPHTAENDANYLDLQAQSLATWVSAKHVKTRLIEVSVIVFAVAFALGFAIARFL